MNKKELKRREREEAEREAKDREESEERPKIIADLFQAIERMVCRGEQPGEGILDAARALAQQWRFEKRPVFEGLLDNRRILLLVALVVALRNDHKFLNLIRKYKSKELQDLYYQSLFALIGLFQGKCELTYEDKRRLRDRVGEIERRFGTEPSPSSALGTAPLPPPPKHYVLEWELLFKPPLIDVILRGETIDIVELQKLFGVSSRQLRRYLKNGPPPVKDGRKQRFNYEHVLQILFTALKEQRSKGKKTGKGRPRRFLGGDPVKRQRALDKIVEHALSIGAPEEIVLRFKDIAILCSKWHNSGRK